jgi:hypothetical protein
MMSLIGPIECRLSSRCVAKFELTVVEILAKSFLERTTYLAHIFLMAVRAG